MNLRRVLVLSIRYTLTDHNGVTFVTGPPVAAHFTGSQYFSCASNGSLQTGNIDFAIACQVKLDDNSADHQIVSKDASGQREYELLYFAASLSFRFQVFASGGIRSLIRLTLKIGRAHV